MDGLVPYIPQGPLEDMMKHAGGASLVPYDSSSTLHRPPPPLVLYIIRASTCRLHEYLEEYRDFEEIGKIKAQGTCMAKDAGRRGTAEESEVRGNC